ncbi:MAG: alpha/beta hydrolase [Thermoleophilaceae bacterium]|nr:alpha/beta hydrolase [Thermoleophilaceae bacterium]
MAPSMPYVAGVEHREVIVRGLRLHVALAGPIDGRPVVLQHGWPQHWYEWRHLIGPLAQAGYRVIAPDFRGFGWSEYPPDEDFLKETLVDDLIALCAELGHRRVSFVGHDWGGWVGWLLCLRRPDLVDRAVLLSAPPPFPAEPTDIGALLRVPRLAYQLPIAAPLPIPAKRACLRLLGRMLGGRPPDEVEAYLEPLNQPSQVRATTLLYRQFLLREIGPLIAGRYGGKRLTMPVLFLAGRDDMLFYEELVEEASPHADDYEGEALPGVGHFIADEAQDLLRERVLRFLGVPASQGTLATPR